MGNSLSDAVKLFICMGVLFLVALIIHESAHLILARRLLDSSANVFYNFKVESLFGPHVWGYVTIPEGSFEWWRIAIVGIAGGASASIVMGLIWFNTRSHMVALASSFLCIFQGVYAFFELAIVSGYPLGGLSGFVPILIAGGWMLYYAHEMGKIY